MKRVPFANRNNADLFLNVTKIEKVLAIHITNPNDEWQAIYTIVLGPLFLSYF